MPSSEAGTSHLVTLLAAVTATGASASADLGDLRDEFSLFVATTGSPTFSVQFQGSVDGTNWFSLGTAVTAVTNGTTVSGTLARYVRANLTALSGGTLTAEVAFSVALGAPAQLPAGSTSTAGILQLDGTAADIQPLGTQAAGTSGLAADAKHVHPPSGWIPSDAGYLEWAYDPLLISAGTALATSGNIYLTRINLRVARSISTVTAYLGALGGTLTSGQCFAGLYAGTTAGAYTAGQLIGTSADQTTAWNTGTGTANTLQAIALTGAPFSVPAGFVWAALMFHGTTGPQFGRAFNVTAVASNIGFAASTARFAAATGATTLPTSITVGNNSLQAPEYWAALS